MSRRWVRLDTTWSQSEWLAELKPECRLVWVEMLCYAKAHGTDGVVKASVVALQRSTGVTRNVVETLVTAATSHGALRREGDLWVLTGWKAYQGDPTAAQRMRRYRQRHQGHVDESGGNTDPAVTRNDRSVTPTETETETETRKNISVKKGVEYTQGFEEVRRIHRKGDKPKAFAAYQKALRITDHDSIVRGLKAYVATFRDDFTGQHLHRWLEGERWDEFADSPVVDLKAHLEAQRRLING